MAHPIDVIGIGADGLEGLRPEQVARINAADFLAGGERQLAHFPDARGVRFIIKDNVQELLKRLYEHRESHRVVLASGDPLFYGIGGAIIRNGSDRNVRIEPSVSSMQLAFARFAIPWQDAHLASVHGRELRVTLLPLLGRTIIGLFTQDGDGPAAVASFFLERDLDDYEAFVGENLGARDERLTHWPKLNELRKQRFAPLNYLILRRLWVTDNTGRIRRDSYRVSLLRSMVPGAPDEQFLSSTVGPRMATSREVRSVVLGKLHLRLKPGDVVWDIGAGLGSIAIEVAVLRPEVEVVAVENDLARAAVLRKNREEFGAWNVRLIEGTAPEALAGETLPPSRVFIGGSGGQLAGILDLVRERLPSHGNFVANFVTLEHLMLSLDRVKSWDWPFEITELQVSRSDALAGLTGLKTQRPVFIVDAQKPGHEVKSE